MARFIKIFTIMTGLSLMTACGGAASDLLNEARDFLAEARAALIKEATKAATESAEFQFLDEKIIDNMLAEEIADGLAPEEQAAARVRIAREVANFNATKQASERAKVADELKNLSPEERDEFNATVQQRLQFLGQAAGGTEETRTTYINECGVGGNTACIDVVSDACAVKDEVGSERCVSFATRVCDVSPLYDVCDDNDDYFLVRDDICWKQGLNGETRTDKCQQIVDTNHLPANAKLACEENYIAGTRENGNNLRCYNAVIAVCDLNPFDSFCQYNTNYLSTRPDRIIACRNRVANAPFCDHAKTFVCDENPFDALCLITDYTPNDYASERQTAIVECGQTFVAGNRCEDAAEQFCGSATGEGLFNPLCLNDPETDAGRQPLCVGERVAVVTTGDNPLTARCTGTATRICDVNPLDPLCEDVAAYRARQLNACVLNPEHPSCAAGTAQFSYITPIIACLENPFGADCINPATEAGAFFADSLEDAQTSHCESGGARTTPTTVETTIDRVNCTNIGSSPVFADLARNITKNGVRTFGTDGTTVTANDVTTENPNIGGFLRAGVFGSRLGDHKGVKPSGGRSGTLTDENNNGNFDRNNENGGAWLAFSDIYQLGDPAEIWDVASTIDPNDGFTYFIAESGEGALLSYAGIWQTTNFGAPLAAPVNQEPTSAIWAGHFTAFSGSAVLNAKPTNFYVDFTDGTFNVHNPDGTDTENPNGTAPKTGSVIAEARSGGNGPESYVSGRYVYTVNGIFGVDKDDPNTSHTNGGVARKLNPGELSGDVTLVNTVYSANNVINSQFSPNPRTYAMPLTGLIGVEGAVGVFVRTESDFSANLGGFTAAPRPAE